MRDMIEKYKTIVDMMILRDYVSINQCLAEVDHKNPVEAVGILRLTRRMRADLEEWQPLLDSVKGVMVEKKMDYNDILRGLL